jgi:hypothetical protein
MSDQQALKLASQKTGPVECLGQKFPTEEARREHFLKLLAEKLKDPEFRKIEGFPIGEDEDILALSDPPYYTACPNPWLDDFLKHYGRPYDQSENYHREPFAADVSEGKNHSIYGAHAYHTKVPHRAIMRYILHYTNPGDVVFDEFCGTGMTGIAARLCGDRSEVQELGYKVDDKGNIYDESGKIFSRLGSRRVILNDLSPTASFISKSYNDIDVYLSDLALVEDVIKETEKTLDSLYAHNGNKVYQGVWSDVFLCPDCGTEIIYWDAAVINGEIQKGFNCPECNARLGKAASNADGAVKMERAITAVYDPVLKSSINQPKIVLVEQTIDEGGKRTIVKVDSNYSKELTLECEKYLSDIPIFCFEAGRQTNKLINGSKIKYVHQMYSPRALAAYSMLWNAELPSYSAQSLLRFCLSGINNYISRKQGYFGGGGGVAGTLFTPSIHLERNVFDVLRRKLYKLPNIHGEHKYAINCSSAADIPITTENVLDYIFIDPPFGENFQYAELNSFIEAWLGVKTSTPQDCVLNYVHKKDISFYGNLMRRSFDTCYRLLKPGRWMTVEFSNTQAAVWNSIQASLQECGFIVANVSALDKVQLQFNAVNHPTPVKQDLVISAYKPSGVLEDRFKRGNPAQEGLLEFIKHHLSNLPIIKLRGGQLDFIAERDPRILYDRMIAFYLVHNLPVPLSSSEFQALLSEKFIEREGMVFLPEQVVEWDKKRASVESVGQMSIFVDDERSAIDWLRNFLKSRPSTYQDIQPEFMQQLGASWKKFETRPELQILLNQNFLQYDGRGGVPSQIHAYLSTQFKELRNLSKEDKALQSKAKDRWFVPDPAKAIDVESIRNKRLLQEFWDLCDDAGIKRTAPGAQSQQALPNLALTSSRSTGGKKLKEVRTEAVRLGFKECFAARDYATILAISAKLPENVIEEDEQLQMIHDMAAMRSQS